MIKKAHRIVCYQAAIAAIAFGIGCAFFAGVCEGASKRIEAILLQKQRGAVQKSQTAEGLKRPYWKLTVEESALIGPAVRHSLTFKIRYPSMEPIPAGARVPDANGTYISL